MARSSKLTAAALLKDMKDLSRILEKYDFKNNSRIEMTLLEKAIDNTAQNCGGKNKGKLVFNTPPDGIVFHTLSTGMSPNPGIKSSKLDVFLSLKYEFCFDKPSLEDTMKNYDLDLQISATQKNHTSKHFFEWHQDVQPQKRSGTKKYQFIHPYYHFHAGGAFLQKKGPGSLLQLSSPRLPHPPMDLILAINFVICNFYSTHESRFQSEMKILDDEEYIDLVKRAAERVYIPFFKGVYSDVANNKFVPLFTK